jgi:hypothetical protein
MWTGSQLIIGQKRSFKIADKTTSEKFQERESGLTKRDLATAI